MEKTNACTRLNNWRKNHPDEMLAQRYRQSLRFVRRFEKDHPEKVAALQAQVLEGAVR